MQEVYCCTKKILKADTRNVFVTFGDKYAVPETTTQDKYASKLVNGQLKKWHEIQDEKQLEDDRRAFTKDERDVIIKAFYDAPGKFRNYAPLIEFYFLTGCRTSEAIAITWNDIDFQRRVIRFSKALGASTLRVKESKTGEIRLFYFQAGSRLEQLLLDLKESAGNADFNLVFSNKKGNYVQIPSICQAWWGCEKKKTLKDGTEKTYYYPGVVRLLVEEGKISGYLPQYHTRHTYITLTALANKHDTNALLYIATSCGNSVDVILKHYLDVQENSQIIQV